MELRIYEMFLLTQVMLMTALGSSEEPPFEFNAKCIAAVKDFCEPICAKKVDPQSDQWQIEITSNLSSCALSKTSSFVKYDDYYQSLRYDITITEKGISLTIEYYPHHDGNDLLYTKKKNEHLDNYLKSVVNQQAYFSFSLAEMFYLLNYRVPQLTSKPKNSEDLKSISLAAEVFAHFSTSITLTQALFEIPSLSYDAWIELEKKAQNHANICRTQLYIRGDYNVINELKVFQNSATAEKTAYIRKIFSIGSETFIFYIQVYPIPNGGNAQNPCPKNIDLPWTYKSSYIFICGWLKSNFQPEKANAFLDLLNGIFEKLKITVNV